MTTVSATYASELARAMLLIAERPDALFIGQGCGVQGTGMSYSFTGIEPTKRIEFPVAEDLQMGACIGLSLQGFLPVCVYPRWNFVLCAANQLVNHLDRLPIYSKGGYYPKVLIRVGVPATHPFNPQSQHDDDLTAAFTLMFRTIKVETLRMASEIVPAYQRALDRQDSTLLVEYVSRYKFPLETALKECA